MEPALFVAELRARLGIHDQDTWCPRCDGILDPHGYHASLCVAGGERSQRHHAVRDLVFCWAEKGGLRPEREKAGLLLPQSPDDTTNNGRRPADADVYLPAYAGFPAALDFAITAPQRQATLAQVSHQMAAAATAYARHKFIKMVRHGGNLYILTSKCAPRHNGFHHLNFQKWSDTEVFCTFLLRKVLRATTACIFSSFGVALRDIQTCFCNVSKVVLCGGRNTFATFSQDELQFSWQAQHFGRVHRHFAWHAQHFRRVVFLLHTPHFALHTSTLHTLHSTLHTSHSTLYTLDSTLHTPHSTLHTLHSTLHTRHMTLPPHSLLYTPHSTLYTLQSTLQTLHSTLHTPHFTHFTLHSTFHTLHSTLHTSHSTRYTLHSTLYTPHSTLYTPHSRLHTLHSTLPTLHSTLYTLDSTLYTSHFTLYTLHFTLHTLHFILHSLHFTHSTLYTLHSTLCIPHSTLCTPHSTFHPHFTL